MVSCLLFLTTLSLWHQLVRAQAPDDFDPLCRNAMNIGNKNFPADVRLLLDSADYITLFGFTAEGSGIWRARSFDGDDGTTSSNNWQFMGGACTQQLSACTFLSQITQNNWVFTHYISYRGAIEVFINITHSFRRCTDENCMPFITLYKYDTDGIVSDDLRTEPSNYRPLFGTEEASRLQRRDTEQSADIDMLRLTRVENKEGFYLAFRDTGTCATIDRVLVYFRFIAGRTETFLQCPDVPFPIAGSGTVSSLSCTCANTTASVGTLVRTCNDNGVCNEDQRCECAPGFGYNSTAERCVVCPIETYKAGISNSSCLPCPALSEARDPGSTICDCVPPNSRDTGSPEEDCRDMRFPTSSAVAITFFVTFLVVGVAAFVGGAVVAYLCRERIEKVVP